MRAFRRIFVITASLLATSFLSHGLVAEEAKPVCTTMADALGVLAAKGESLKAFRFHDAEADVHKKILVLYVNDSSGTMDMVTRDLTKGANEMCIIPPPTVVKKWKSEMLPRLAASGWYVAYTGVVQ